MAIRLPSSRCSSGRRMLIGTRATSCSGGSWPRRSNSRRNPPAAIDRMTSLTVASPLPRARFRAASSALTKPTRRSRPISWLRKVCGGLGPRAARFANPSAVRMTADAVPRGMVRALRAALPAARSGARIPSEAARTKSSSGLGSSGSQRSSPIGISVPSGFGSSMIVPTSTAETPSTNAWCVFEM